MCSDYIIEAYSDKYHDQWDDLVDQSPVATPLHSWKFLSYHEHRFIDQSLLIFDKKQLVAVFPLAQSPDNDREVVSHPGASYSGIVHDGRLKGNQFVEVLAVICRYLSKQGYNNLVYKSLPSIYRDCSCEDDRYALFRLNAECFRVDLSATIDLKKKISLSKRRSRALKTSQKNNIVFANDWKYIDTYWDMLTENLLNKHAVKPVHTVQEIKLLQQRFPQQIQLRCALNHGDMVAGVVLFLFKGVAHAQYIASSEKGKTMNALDALFNQVISECHSEGMNYFDFGISSEQQGRKLNDGLYQFKSGFGASGTCHQFFRINLSDFRND